MFRLNLEQQANRARELLEAARKGDAAALGKFTTHPPRLAEAQLLVARELRFENWAQLKKHIAQMTRERDASDSSLDVDLRTLHIRCGSDIRETLQRAGFRGVFHEHSYPYLIARVREDLSFDEQALVASSKYERVVIWSEADCYDQLVLVRLLAHYAVNTRPGRLELVNVRDFPGEARFIGLGQLPPEALRMVWATRRQAGPEVLVLGLGAWRALASPDPRALAAIMRSGTPALPLLAPALHRHLRELPSTVNGLSFTQELAMNELAQNDYSLNNLFLRLNYIVDPLPGQGDLQVRDRLLEMEGATDQVFTRRPGVDSNGHARPPWTDVLTISELGRAVLRGDVDYMSLKPPPRWVGGVAIGVGHPDWRWDEQRKDAVSA